LHQTQHRVWGSLQNFPLAVDIFEWSFSETNSSSTLYLIVHPNYRGLGLAKRVKAASFQLARLRWPKAKLFSLTSGAAVMKMNTELGYVPVTFNELTDDAAFWKGCEGCVNHDILVAKNRKFCICTAMLYDPADHEDDRI
jgi:GNAT superfamily N-acetyltransferase